MKPKFTPRGYTLIEMLLVLAIMALLAVTSFPMFGMFRKMAGYAGCISNLRILHVGLNTYMQDHEMVWPQVPEGGYEDENKEWKWWNDTLKDYGVATTHWVCPSDDTQRGLGEDDPDAKGETYKGSYTVTLFDDGPNTAFRWNQPWAIERGGYHKKFEGPNMLMPDGTIMSGPALMSR
ncbi:MAG: type II secretion system protein [Verrucomicrobium sp.]